MDSEVFPKTAPEVDVVLRATKAWAERQRDLAAKLSEIDPSLIAQAVEYFESAEEAGRFLITPARYLGGKSPVEVAHTPEGIHHVRQLLSAIEHGVYL